MNAEFLNACETGNLNEVLNILYYHDNGPVKLLQTDPSTLDHMPYFHAVCLNGHCDVVEQLFYFDVDVNMDSRYGTPLAVACQGGHIDTVKTLIKHGATIHDRSTNATLTPFFQACKHGHLDILIYLIEEEPLALVELGPQLLVEACREGFLDIVILLLSKNIDIDRGILPSSSSRETIPYHSSLETPLQAACSQNQVEVVEYLLQEGAEVGVSIVQEYYQVLEEAVKRNFKEHKGRYRRKRREEKPVLEGDLSTGNFYEIHKSWFTEYAQLLVSLNLSNNQLNKIPKEVLNLPSLRIIDLSANDLYDLPEIDNVEDSRLEEIIAASNHLKLVPTSFFNIKCLRHLNLVNNNIVSLLNHDVTDEQFDMDDVMNDSVVWNCHSLKALNLTRNELTFIPTTIHAAKSLEKLQLCGNKLTSFPLGWKCPLRILNLSQNELTDFKQSVFNTWTQTLVDLNLSSNKITSISWDICQLQMLQYLDLSYNAIENMPPKSYWKCSNLRKLNLSNNQLFGLSNRIETTSPSRNSRRFTITRSPVEERVEIEDEFPHEVFGGTLETLDLSDNKLAAVPSSVCRLTALEELNLSGNRHLRTLPPELGNLTECYQLGLVGLHLSGIPKYARSGQYSSSKDVLTYLRAKQRKGVAYNRMKLMVIGLQGRGKTTLLAALRNQPLPPNISTVGIVVNEWTVSASQSLLEKVTLIGKKDQSNPAITFSTWDLAGQQIYYSTHQCFLSSNTLYLAVWNVSTGEEGIDRLKPWLLNVQARAPGSHVIIVGTHVDLLPSSGKEKRIHELNLTIAKRYNKKGFPIIKGYHMVSCTTGENMSELRQAIYQAALELKETENTGKGESLIGRKIPLSYLKLQQNVIKEAEQRKKENKPPILNEDQMLELAKQDPNNDILERDELILAARFLHENGVILHYNDRSRGLDQLYFIEPGWLCEIMALLVTVKETNTFVKGGIIEKSNVNLLLKNPRLPPEFMEQYIQLMERFEVALTLDEHRLLVPSMLPRDKPGLHLADLGKMLSGGNRGLSTVSEGTDCEAEGEDPKTSRPLEYLRRLYKMNYVPSGFWSRLIARLMIAVQRWGAEEGLADELICDEEGKDVRSSSNFRPVPHSYSMIYWREGMGVVYQGGHLLVESYTEKERNAHTGTLEDIEGVMVTVWSVEGDFSVLGFVTDQINSLISEWYPGLEESDKHGIPLVRHVIPCPKCSNMNGGPLQRMRRSLSMRNVQELEETKPPEFSLMECAAAAVDYTEIACPGHEDSPVKLSSLVPDLVLSDLPSDFVIDNKAFVFNPSEENRLGSGGAGEVFLGMYKKQKVAVKRFYSSGSGTDSGLGPSVGIRNRGDSRHTAPSKGSFSARNRVFTVAPTTIEEDLRRTKILSSFMELRQEVSVLGRLNHPCVVALIGVSIQPLCIVLELSPLGSLYSILEKAIEKLESEKFQPSIETAQDVRKPIFDRYLTYKIIYQVAHALHYLHDIGIIYRDLKSDNLLVWTLEKDAVVHVKLSDYGISRFATPQGMLGEEGTPGFQAPEVRAGSTYNEKVDIFSFAMLIYEILSGLRPFHECRSSAQIKKFLRRGERPSLQRSYLDSEMPELEALMTRCWRESAARRPSSETILQLMEDPSFLSLDRAMPYLDEEIWSSITALIPVSDENHLVSNEGELDKGSHSVLLWGGEDNERFYSVVDCKTGLNQVPQTLCCGPRVACLAKVGDRYWLGTEGSVIEVFGRAKPTSELKVLWSIKLNAQVLGLEVEYFQHRISANLPTDHVRRIFACLANGSVVVISRPDLRQASSSSCSFQFRADSNEKLRQEATVFSVMTSIQLSEPGTSACCLLFVKDGRELWVGCGNQVGIIDVDTLDVVHKIRAYVSPRSNIRSMVTNGHTVFTINRKTPDVFQWDIESRQCICKFNVEQENPRGLNVARLITPKQDDNASTGDVTDDVNTSDVMDGNDGVECPSFDDSTDELVDAAKKPEMFIDVNKYPVRRFHKQPSLMRSMRRSDSRNSSRRKHENKQDSVSDSSTPSGREQKMRSRTQVMSNTERRVTCALIVDGNLWVGRESGDIVIIKISDELKNPENGSVHAVLTVGTEHGHIIKGVPSMLRVGRDKVVSCTRIIRERIPTKPERTAQTAPVGNKRSFVTMRSPIHQFFRSHPLQTATQTSSSGELPVANSEKYQVCVWERWSSNDFKAFYKYHEDLENAS